ncbi:hypothetical protein B0I35DRAFT_94173 [Stachybotrys elegans]|uniref:Uncharacterized protein n=1 Tax=Stachybotrys elegans TaxID=80388 RepID=A0A8K0WM90_9HYPO|nr:hypothetical protein B0I35DRAFT_94173 [Stachybotrys elegans]
MADRMDSMVCLFAIGICHLRAVMPFDTRSGLGFFIQVPNPVSYQCSLFAFVYLSLTQSNCFWWRNVGARAGCDGQSDLFPLSSLQTRIVTMIL